MIVLIWLVIVALAIGVNMILAGITIWSVNEIFNFDMPFWPVFWLIVVVAAVCGGSARAGKDSK